MRFRLICVESADALVKVVARGEDGKKYLIKVTDFRPYFYVKTTDYERDFNFLDESPLVVGFEEGFTGIKGEDLTRVYTMKPKYVGKLRKRYPFTWEANITYTRRFMVDLNLKDFFEIDDDLIVGENFRARCEDIKSIDTVVDWEHEEVIFGYDIETYGHVTPETPMERVINISGKIFGKDVIYDLILAPTLNYKEFEFVIKRERKWSDDINDGRVYEIKEIFCENEHTLITEFASLLKSLNPDVLVGYNIHGFDNKVMHGRMDYNNISRSKLSTTDDWARDEKLAGMVNADIQIIWTFNQAQEVRWETLQEVAGDVANYKLPKEVREEIPTLFDEGKYTEISSYAHHDVIALEKIDEVDNTVDSLLNFMRELGIDEFMLTKETQKQKVNALFVAHEDEKIPTESEDKGESTYFQGGEVYPPVPGKHTHVGVLDLSKIYPTIIVDGNISYETHIEEGGLLLPNGQRFLQGKDGILPRIAKHMFEMRKFYERKMAEAKTHEEYKMWYNKRQSVKISTNSLYGVMTFPSFPLFSMAVAETITYIARECLRVSKETIESYGFKVLYGDTDSIFVQFDMESLDDCVQSGTWLAERINEALLDYSIGLGFKQHNFKIEFETIFGKLILKDKKKRYAGKVIWQDGETLTEERQHTMIKGFDVVRSSAAGVTRESLKDLLEALVTDKSDDFIQKMLRSYYTLVENEECELEYICPYPTLKQELYKPSNYFLFDAVVASHELFGLEIKRGRYHYVYVYPDRIYLNLLDKNLEMTRKNVKIFAFKKSEDLPEIIRRNIDYRTMAEKCVLNKAKLVLEPIRMSHCMDGVCGSKDVDIFFFGGKNEF